ncbi:hypothetical protein F5876DRAFT_74585 [Lentinula aff. lateritia]|uniref:Uncharacterized protein n=1 Tax=Lentinula aff. lateritia TaxID=2804960 RepID=A0ACC1U7E3_9AGAR|nr:hypothetical protein F5876DRAFT_74585 [Lentinula aff. lateritia]
MFSASSDIKDVAQEHNLSLEVRAEADPSSTTISRHKQAGYRSFPDCKTVVVSSIAAVDRHGQTHGGSRECIVDTEILALEEFKLLDSAPRSRNTGESWFRSLFQSTVDALPPAEDSTVIGITAASLVSQAAREKHSVDPDVVVFSTQRKITPLTADEDCVYSDVAGSSKRIKRN